VKHLQKSVLIWFSPQQMYSLVTDVARYPDFLPWCSHADVLSCTDLEMTACIGLSMAGIHQQFTTCNQHDPGRRVRMKLVDGPFSQLEGDWHFLPVGADASACKITLDLKYAFSSRTLAALVGPVFDRVANSLVDAFVKRAEQVYA
jgi:ribosome-associated toxin RatA of RatAB toxin-antitoxin module